MYHVFFSYRNTEKDKEWVRSVIKILKTQHNFICCDHDIDFLPGRSIRENIKECIKKSVKTVIVLSKEYNESFFCKNELEYAVHMQMSQRQHILIPIEKEDCDIPESLEIVTRIDARGDTESWIHRLVSAIEAPVEETNTTQPLLTYQSYSNFAVISKETTVSSCRSEGFPIEHSSDALRRLGIDCSSEFIKKLSSTRLVRQRAYINPSWPVCVICYFVLPELFFGGITATVLDSGFLGIGIVCLLLYIVFGVVWPMCCCYLNIKSFLTSKRKTAENQITKDEENTEFIEMEDVSLLGSNDSIRTENEADVYNTLLEISPEYFKDYLSGNLSKSKNFRHCKREICMCEYLELKAARPTKRCGNQQIIEV